MDIFVELLDDEEANRVMNYFQEQPLGTRKNTANLEQKKQHIKRIFKSATPNMIRKRRKGGPDPFYTYINKYKDIPMGKTFKDSVIMFSDINNVAPYFLYSKLLLKYPEETRGILEKISENIKENLPPFTNIYNFDVKEELIDFLRKYKQQMGEQSSDFLLAGFLKHTTFLDRVKEQYEKCKEEVRDYDFLKFYNEYSNLKEKYGVELTNISYINMHDEEDAEIKMLLTIDLILEYLQNNKVDKSNENKIESIVNKYETQLFTKNQTIKEMAEEINELRAVQKLNIKESKVVIKQKEKMQQEIETLKKFLNLEEEKSKEVITNLEQQTKQIRSEYKSQINLLKKTIEMENLIKKDRLTKFYEQSAIKRNWGIICLVDYELTTEMFPELNIVNPENKEQCTKLYKNTDVETVYLLTKGISSRKIRSIKIESEKYNKKLVTLEIGNFKEFIEWIGYIKTSERQGILV